MLTMFLDLTPPWFQRLAAGLWLSCAKTRRRATKSPWGETSSTAEDAYDGRRVLQALAVGVPLGLAGWWLLAEAVRWLSR